MYIYKLCHSSTTWHVVMPYLSNSKHNLQEVQQVLLIIIYWKIAKITNINDLFKCAYNLYKRTFINIFFLFYYFYLMVLAYCDRILETEHGIHCNMTLLFSFCQVCLCFLLFLLVIFCCGFVAIKGSADEILAER